MGFAAPGFTGGLMSSEYSSWAQTAGLVRSESDMAQMRAAQQANLEALLRKTPLKNNPEVVKFLRAPMTLLCDYCGNGRAENRRECWSCGAPYQQEKTDGRR